MEKILENNFYWSIDLGINQKGGKTTYKNLTNYESFYGVEIPIVIGYSLLNSIDFYISGYFSFVFTEGNYILGIIDRSWFGFNHDYGFIFGIEYNVIFLIIIEKLIQIVQILLMEIQ